MKNSYKDFYEVVKSNGLFCTRASGTEGKIEISGWVHIFALQLVVRIRRYENSIRTETLAEEAQRYCDDYKEWMKSLIEKPALYESIINDSRDKRELNFMEVYRA